MKTYFKTKKDGTMWMIFFDTNIRYWTVINVDSENNQISKEADYFANKDQMNSYHQFGIK